MGTRTRTKSAKVCYTKSLTLGVYSHTRRTSSAVFEVVIFSIGPVVNASTCHVEEQYLPGLRRSFVICQRLLLT